MHIRGGAKAKGATIKVDKKLRVELTMNEVQKMAVKLKALGVKDEGAANLQKSLDAFMTKVEKEEDPITLALQTATMKTMLKVQQAFQNNDAQARLKAVATLCFPTETEVIVQNQEKWKVFEKTLEATSNAAFETFYCSANGQYEWARFIEKFQKALSKLAEVPW